MLVARYRVAWALMFTFVVIGVLVAVLVTFGNKKD